MQEEIVNAYRNAGYTPEQTIESLIGIVGAAILSLNKTTNTASYSNHLFSVEVQVVEDLDR